MKTMLVLPGSRKPIEAASPFVSEMQFCAAHNTASDVIEVNQCRECYADNERGRAKLLYNALRGIVEIGKRDMTNPKYDGYFETAKVALAKCDQQ